LLVIQPGEKYSTSRDHGVAGQNDLACAGAFFRRESRINCLSPMVCADFSDIVHCQHLEGKLYSRNESPRTGLECTLTTLAGEGIRLFIHPVARMLHRLSEHRATVREPLAESWLCF